MYQSTVKALDYTWLTLPGRNGLDGRSVNGLGFCRHMASGLDTLPTWCVLFVDVSQRLQSRGILRLIALLGRERVTKRYMTFVIKLIAFVIVVCFADHSDRGIHIQDLTNT